MAKYNHRPTDVEPTIHEDSVLILVVDEDGPRRPRRIVNEEIRSIDNQPIAVVNESITSIRHGHFGGINTRAIDAAHPTVNITPVVHRIS